MEGEEVKFELRISWCAEHRPADRLVVVSNQYVVSGNKYHSSFFFPTMGVTTAERSFIRGRIIETC
jgi:hypothetical protein